MSIYSLQFFPINLLNWFQFILTCSCQFFHFHFCISHDSSFMSKNSLQFIHCDLIYSIYSFHFLHFIHSFQFIHLSSSSISFPSFHSFACIRCSSFMSIHLFWLPHFNSFISILYFPSIHDISFVSIHVIQFLHVELSQVIRVSWFMSVHAFHAFVWLPSLLSNSPWSPMTYEPCLFFGTSALAGASSYLVPCQLHPLLSFIQSLLWH